MFLVLPKAQLTKDLFKSKKSVRVFALGPVMEAMHVAMQPQLV